MDGLLCKFTNLVKGWQYRWFILDSEHGTLAYYLDKERVKLGPRGILPLSGSVISPSDEDDVSFMVNGADGEFYKLKASDTRDRQQWINMIRAVAEYHTQYSAANVVQTNSQRSSPTVNSERLTLRDSNASIKSNDNHSLRSASPATIIAAPPKQFSKQHQVYSTTENPIKDELRNVSDALNSVSEFQTSAVEVLESGPNTADPGGTLDEQVLVLKATSQACVNILQQCYKVLMKQANDVQLCATQRGLPPGAEIRWMDPADMVYEKTNKLTRTDSNESSDGVFTSMDQYAVEEVEDPLEEEAEQQEDMEAHKSVILHLLSQLKLGMDLTRVVLPTFVLEKRSLLEMYSDFFCHPDMFSRIPDGASPRARILAVLQFYLTSFHVGRKIGVAKKPYNPIIGEMFHCSIGGQGPTSSNQTSDPDETLTEDKIYTDRVFFTSEQVSHHPPISCFYAECPTKKICMNTHIWTKSKFFGMSIGVVNVGEAIIYVADHDEEYIITFPNAYCRSILTFPWVELGGRTFIRCAKTGYNATIVFHAKPFYGGKQNRVTVEVKDETDSIFCNGDGYWDDKIELTFTDEDEKPVMIDISKMRVTPKCVRPISVQGDMESRKLWRNVTENLRLGNLPAATDAKHALEENQRKEEKERLSLSQEFKSKLFRKNGDSWIFNHHMHLIKLKTGT